MSGTERVLRKVRAYLDNMGVSYLPAPAGMQGVQIPYESAMILVLPIETDDSVLVMLLSAIVQEIPLSPALFRRIATDQPNFSTLLVWTDPETGESNLNLRYTIPGDYLDEPEFRQAVAFFAAEADQLDDDYADTFGGRTFTRA